MATPPLSPAVLHFLGPWVIVEGRFLRQRCAWCGAMLVDVDLGSVAAEWCSAIETEGSFPIEEPPPCALEPESWVAVAESEMSTVYTADEAAALEGCPAAACMIVLDPPDSPASRVFAVIEGGKPDG